MNEHERVQRVADILIGARNDHTALEPFDADIAPQTEAEANAVDDLVAEISGWTAAGWKIGCTSEHAQQMLGASGPFAGRVYSVFDSGSTLGPAELMNEPNLEGEFAFTLGSDLTASTGGHHRDDVIAAAANVRPVIEIVGGRFIQFVGAPLFNLISDAGANSHLILGDPVPLSDAEALAGFGATMTVNGERSGGGVGADVLGSPIDALTWLANHLSGRGISLRAGEVITTGTATQVSPFPPGATAVAELENIGPVTLHRAG